MPLVVLNSSNYASYSNIAAAIIWAADHGARAINVSIGGTSASSTLQSAVNYAWSKGAVVFAAAMNAATSTPAYPAACDKVVAVAATDESDQLASFSSYGTWIDLTAPGTSMLTTTRGGGYGYWQGTSFSSPLVAGVAALMWSVNPNLTAATLVNLLQLNSDDLGSAGFDTTYGYGRLNAYKAVLAAQNSVSYDTSAPTVAIWNPSPGAVVAGTMQVQGSALDNVAVTKVEFYVDGQLNGSSTLAAFSFAWNTATPTNGAHTLAVKAYDAAGNAGSASLSTSVSNATLTDTTAPAVAITSPANGAIISSAININATATDPGGIKLVYFYIDGVLCASDAVAPYSYAWDARKATRAKHTIKVTAVDSAGNSASDSISVKK